jgi:hypothetical protein
MKTRTKLVELTALLILLGPTGAAQAGRQRDPAGGLDPADLKAKFFQVCDVAVQKVNLPEREYSSELPVRKVPFYVDSYVVRALAVAYDLTGREDYLDAIKTWSDRMITNQEKMIPYGAYYMNYGRAPFAGSGDWYVADCAEISMGILATAVRCQNPLEKRRYLRSVEAFAGLVLENYVGPNGGIINGLWPAYHGEWWASTAYMGPLFFRLYEETGDGRYLEAGLNTVYWFVNLESLRSASPDRQFVEFNAPDQGNPYPTKPKQSAGGILNQLNLYNTGASYIFSGDLEIGRQAKKELAFFEKWCSENLLGRGESGTFQKYDSRKEKVGGKFGAIPFQIYCLARQGLFSSGIVGIADRELQRIVAQVFVEKEILTTEFVAFAMVSMAEKVSPGSVLRKSLPLYRTGGPPGRD